MMHPYGKLLCETKTLTKTRMSVMQNRKSPKKDLTNELKNIFAPLPDQYKLKIRVYMLIFIKITIYSTYRTNIWRLLKFVILDICPFAMLRLLLTAKHVQLKIIILLILMINIYKLLTKPDPTVFFLFECDDIAMDHCEISYVSVVNEFV